MGEVSSSRSGQVGEREREGQIRLSATPHSPIETLLIFVFGEGDVGIVDGCIFGGFSRQLEKADVVERRSEVVPVPLKGNVRNVEGRGKGGPDERFSTFPARIAL